MRTFDNTLRMHHLFSKFALNHYKMFREYGITVITGLLMFFTPIQGLIVSVGIAIILDTFTGVYKSIKLRGFKSIRSHKLSTIVSKMVLYQVSLLCLFPIDKFVLNDLLINIISVEFFATKLACVLLLIVELTSIKENVEEALKIDLWKSLRALLRRVKDVSDDVNDIQNPQ
jgi:hypothetical protein